MFVRALLFTTCAVGATATRCRCSLLSTSRPGTNFGTGCRAHDLNLALPCTVVGASATSNRTRTGTVENAPFCERRWCYVDDPRDCVDASTGASTAHMSSYDTMGNLVQDVGYMYWSGQDVNTADYIWKGFNLPLGKALYYSYAACGDVDLYTLPKQRRMESEWSGLGVDIYNASLLYTYYDQSPTGFGGRPAFASTRCEGVSRRFYPWDVLRIYESWKNQFSVQEGQHLIHTQLDATNYLRSFPIDAAVHLTDGEDGFFPSYCQNPSVRGAEFGIHTPSPSMCMAFVNGNEYYVSNSMMQTMTAPTSKVSWWNIMSAFDYGSCGDLDKMSVVKQMYMPHLLGGYLMSTHELFQPLAEATSERAMKRAVQAGHARVSDVRHVDDCASLCAGTLRCKRWMYVSDGDFWLKEGDVLEARNVDGVLELWSGVTRIFVTNFAKRRNLEFKTYMNALPNLLEVMESNLSSTVELRSSTLPQLLNVWNAKTNSSLFTFMAFYVRSRCYMASADADLSPRLDDPPSYFLGQRWYRVQGAHGFTGTRELRSTRLQSALVNDGRRNFTRAEFDAMYVPPFRENAKVKEGNTAYYLPVVVLQGTAVLDIEPTSFEERPLRDASVHFLKKTWLGKTLRDALFEEGNYFNFKGRKEQMQQDLLKYNLGDSTELDRIDSPRRIVDNGVATTVMRIVLEMRATRSVRLQAAVPHIRLSYDMTVYKCDDNFRGDGVKGCPLDVHAVGFDRFVDNQVVFPWDRVGIASVVDQITVENVLRNSCIEQVSASLIYNETDLYVVFKDTEYTRFEQSYDAWAPGEFRMCTSPYLPGRVHCGALRSATRAMAKLFRSSSLVDPDLCTIFMRGNRCRLRPSGVRFHFGGFSMGTPYAVTFLMLVDRMLERHYGIDIRSAAASVDVNLWAFHSFADREFVDAYMARFGDVTDAYVDRSDIFADTFAPLGAAALTDVRAHVAGALGGCGYATPKRMRDCVDYCSTGNDNTFHAEGCLRWWVNVLSSSTRGHELVAVMMLDGKVPDHVQASEHSESLNSIVALVDIADNLWRWAGATSDEDTHSMCVDRIYRDLESRPICTDEITASPWTYSAFLQHARDEAGSHVGWCLAERARLLARNEDVSDWERICCGLPANHLLTLDDLRAYDSFANPSYTGDEVPPPTPPPPPPMPPAPPP